MSRDNRRQVPPPSPPATMFKVKRPRTFCAVYDCPYPAEYDIGLDSPDKFLKGFVVAMCKKHGDYLVVGEPLQYVTEEDEVAEIETANQVPL